MDKLKRLTAEEWIDSLDVEAFASWVYTFTAPVGVVPWKRLPQQRREAFVKAIGAGMSAAYPKEERSTKAEEHMHTESRLRFAVIEALDSYSASAIKQIVTGVFYERDALTEEEKNAD